jgi:hypothetical protein
VFVDIPDISRSPPTDFRAAENQACAAYQSHGRNALDSPPRFRVFPKNSA